jgi:hypothetical protein
MSESTPPDLSKLPAPAREIIESALREQSIPVETPEEAAERAVRHWTQLRFAVGMDLEDWLIPFANVHSQPADWTGLECRRVVTMQLPGLAPIRIAYETAVNAPGWVRASEWLVAGKKYYSLKTALLAAYLASDGEKS